jgi:UDPglucose 6-dehydrogenase
MKNPPRKVAFLGLGYVGLCTAAAFASRGFEVIGIDIDAQRVDTITSGKAPFHEPGLGLLLRKALRTGRFTATTDTTQSSLARFVFITVGTPGFPNGSIDLTYVMNSLTSVGTTLREANGYHLIIIKSTVVPGTSLAARLALETASGRRLGDKLGLCANPEFLKEGTAIKDTLRPDKIVIGRFDRRSGEELRSLYRLFHKKELPPVILTTPQTAEMIKYASNAFLATKVSFINTMANICQRTPGVDVADVARAIGLDPRIGSLFLKAGPGYGGSCFHKDIQALIRYSQSKGYRPTLLQATEHVNEDQVEQVVRMAKELVGELMGRRVAILGLAFKKDTDDIREAPSLRVIQKLLKEGAELVAYDPMAMQNAKQLLDGTVNFAGRPEEALKGADLCILMTEWNQFRNIRPGNYLAHMRRPNILDARRIHNPTEYQGLKFIAIGLGERITER